MEDMTPDKIKNLLETAIKNNTTAWSAQSRYFDELLKRNVVSMTHLSEARIASLKEIGESQTFNQAFEANIAYENAVLEELKKLYDSGHKSWEALQEELEGIYSASSTDDAAA